MNEFVKSECACDLGYDKGALKKTIENNIFTIFGNLNQKNSIVIRYHGMLTENNSTKYNIYYYFDAPKNDKTYVKLEKCHKCSGECYCVNIDLENHTKIFFGFTDETTTLDNNNGKDFNLTIDADPISNLMQRYGFEQNPNLPTCEQKEETLNKFKGILAKIQNFFKKFVTK